MNDYPKSERLVKLCDEASRRLSYIIKLVEHIRCQDAASPNAVAWLRAECCTRSYCGANYEYCMENIFAELEAMESDETLESFEQQA